MRKRSRRAPITVAIADDHQIVREGIRCLIESAPDIHIVAEVDDGLALLRVVERMKPQVAILDLWMPGLNGLDTTEQVRRRFPDTSVVILASSTREEHLRAALRNGAAGYVSKASGALELIRAIRAVAAGRVHLGPPFAEPERKKSPEATEDRPADPYESLSHRERQVLQLVAEGETSRSIAGRLGISRRTAETYRAALKKKLKVPNQAQLIRYALDRGILGPGPRSGKSE